MAISNSEKIVKKVEASMNIEGFNFSKEHLNLLKDIASNKINAQDIIDKRKAELLGKR